MDQHHGQVITADHPSGDGSPSTNGSTNGQVDSGVARDLDALRDLVTHAKSMPMSASCIVNRAEALALVDRIATALPRELGEARGLLEQTKAQITQAEAEANRIVEQAREQAAELASHTSVVKQAEEIAATLKRDSETEAAELRVETDSFIDERMASFESVLQKTASQVKTARARLSARSGLDDQE